MNEVFLRALVVEIPLVLLLIFVVVRSRKRNALRSAKKDQLKSLYRDEAIFLCDDAEDMGGNLIQLYGEPSGASVRPGMKITVPSGEEYIIKEVYGSDKTPDKPTAEIPVGISNFIPAIVIESDHWDWNSFRESKKREKILALKLR